MLVTDMAMRNLGNETWRYCIYSPVKNLLAMRDNILLQVLCCPGCRYNAKNERMKRRRHGNFERVCKLST